MVTTKELKYIRNVTSKLSTAINGYTEGKFYNIDSLEHYIIDVFRKII